MTLNKKLVAVLNKTTHMSYSEIIFKIKGNTIRNPITWIVPKMNVLIDKGLVEGNYYIGYKLK